MYTTQKHPLAKLRAYARELTDRYHEAMERHHFAEARALRDRRTRVWRAILVWQEWAPEPPPDDLLRRIQRLPGQNG